MSAVAIIMNLVLSRPVVVDGDVGTGNKDLGLFIVAKMDLEHEMG